MKNYASYALCALLALPFAAGITSCSEDCDTYYESQRSTDTDKSKTVNGHRFVDLGLPSGTLWATCNVGAANPPDAGDYFAWGETKSKDSYGYGSYTWCRASGAMVTKYCTDSHDGLNGFKDSKTQLEAEDDAATANWGKPCRMPTGEEFGELLTNCRRTWVNTYEGASVSGCIFTSKKNGNHIFLPAAGSRSSDLHEMGRMGGYWSSTLEPLHGCHYARILYFDRTGGGDTSAETFFRDYGLPVRAVTK